MDPMKRKAIQYTVTFIGQIILIVLYTIMGAAVFRRIELPHEEVRRNQLIADTVNNRTKLIARIQNITEEYYDTDREVWLRRVTWLITNMEKRMGLNIKDIERSDERTWSFSSALFFSATVITTIGYGHIAPVTTAGRIFCMAYAVFGISLLLLVLASIGSLLARGATLTYRMLHDKIGTFTIGKKKKKPEEDPRNEAYLRQNGDHVAAQDQHREKVIDDIWGTIRFDKDGKMIMPGEPSSRTNLSSQSNGDPLPRKDSKDTSKLRVNFADGKNRHDDGEDNTRVFTPQGMYLPPSPEPTEPIEIEHSIGFGVMDDEVGEEEVNVPLHVVLVLACIYIVLLAGTLLLWEDQWDFFDALYFSFVTLTTIGFGDLVPQHQKNLLACTFLIILGMAIISMCIALAQDLIMRKIAWLSQKVGVALLRSSKEENE